MHTRLTLTSVSPTLISLLVLVAATWLPSAITASSSSSAGIVKYELYAGDSTCSESAETHAVMSRVTGCVNGDNGTSTDIMCTSDGVAIKTFAKKGCVGPFTTRNVKSSECAPIAVNSTSYIKVASCLTSGPALTPLTNGLQGERHMCMDVFSESGCKGSLLETGCQTIQDCAPSTHGGLKIDCSESTMEFYTNAKCSGSPITSQKFAVGGCLNSAATSRITVCSSAASGRLGPGQVIGLIIAAALSVILQF